MEEVRKKFLIIFLIVLFSLSFILAASNITFQTPTPSNGSTTTSPVTIFANISDTYNTSSFLDLNRDLVGYWPMDYANSTHVYDNSSYKNNATFKTGLSLSNITTGVRGNGMDFVGDGGCLGISYSSQYNITQGLTLSIWIKRTTTYTQTRDMHLLTKDNSWYFYDAYNSGQIRGVVFIDGVIRGGLYSGVIPNDGNWYNVVYTYSSETGYARMYVNGLQVSSANLTGLSNYRIDGNNTASFRDVGWHNLQRGVVLDEAMVYNRSLNLPEIKALYNSQINKFNTSLLSLSLGKHNYTLYTINLNGETSNSGLRNFIIGSDSSNPSITFELPTPSNTSTASNPVTIVANISDASNTSSLIDFDRTLVAYWAMDYYNSTGIYDNSSWNNFASFVSGTGINGISTGVRGDSLEFYGNTSRLTIPKLGSSTANTFNVSGELTFSAWINPENLTIYRGIMGSDNIRLHALSSGNLLVTIVNRTSNYNQLNVGPFLSNGSWSHVALTYNRSNGNTSVYHNGIIVGSKIILNANLTSASDYFTVGYNWGDSFQGFIDEAMVFNRTLSQTEIKALYNSKFNKFNTSAMTLANGKHNYTVYAIDELGNFVSSGLRNFDIGEIDSTSPIISFESPTPDNGSSTSSPVTVVANISDASNTSSWIDLDRSLLGYWAMDYANSTHVFDNSSYRSNGSFNGGLGTSDLITGSRGEALEFDGSNDYIIVPKGAVFNDITTSGNYTFSAWIKVNSFPANSAPIIGITQTSTDRNQFGIGSSGELGITIYNGTYTQIGRNSAINLNQWYHFVGVNDGGELYVYIDGVYYQETGVDQIYGGAAAGFYMGMDTSFLRSYLNGSLDEVMIFNRVLSATEVKALYSSQINKFNTSAMNLADGQHNYTVYAIDEYGNFASSGERNFNIGAVGSDACGTLSTTGATYTLTSNVSSTGTCFTVTAPNVTIDCNGYWINYSTGGGANTYGVYTNQLNTTVKNCKIVDGKMSSSNSYRFAINGVNSNYSTIFNNSITTNTSFADGVRFNSISYFNNITSNNFNVSNANSVYIRDYSNNNTISNNNVYSSNRGEIMITDRSNYNKIINNKISLMGTSAGIYVFYFSNGNIIMNNTIYSTYAYADAGIRMEWFSSYNNITNNNITTNNYGMWIHQYSNNNTFVGNIITNYRQFGVVLEYDSWYNNFTNNNISSNSDAGFFLRSNSSYNTFLNNNITSNSSVGLYILTSNNNTLTNNSATSTTYHGIYVRLSNNTILTNNNGTTLGNVSAGSGIYIYSSTNNNLTNNIGKGFLGNGFSLDSSSYHNLTGNRGISTSGYAIYLSSSSNNNLIGNNATSNTSSGIFIYYSSNNNLTGNNATSNMNDGIYLYYASDNTLTGNRAYSPASYGFYISFSSNNRLIDNNATSDIRDGFRITSSSNNTLTNNIGISNSSEGIQIDASSNITLFSNKGISTSGFGIHLSSSSNNNLTGNNATSNTNDGISLYDSSDNTLTNNKGTSISGHGIYLWSSSNNNLTGNNATSSAESALFLNSVLNSKLVNNQIRSDTSSGLYLNSASNNNLTGNNVTSGTNTGIYLSGSYFNTLTRNNGTSLGNGYGISVISSPNNTFINNFGESLGSGYGFYDASSSNSTLIQNTGKSSTSSGILVGWSSNHTFINNTGISSYASPGIYLYSVSNFSLVNNNGTSNSGAGIYLSGASNLSLINNNGTSNSGYGFFVTGSSDNTFIYNTAITLITGSALYIVSSSERNNFINQIAKSPGISGTNYGIFISVSNNSIFRDCLNITGNTADVYVDFGSFSINNTFINCSYNTAKETVQGAGNELIRKWYYQAYVNYSNGTAAAGANVSGYNVSSALQFSENTNGSGWIQRQEVTEYINRVGTRSYFNNYSISPTKTGYTAATHIFNFTTQQNKMDDWFTLYNTTCVYVGGNWYINCSEGCTVIDSFDVQGNNISIVGSGTVLVTGNVTNYNKLHIEGVDTTHICTVRCLNGGCFKS